MSVQGSKFMTAMLVFFLGVVVFTSNIGSLVDMGLEFKVVAQTFLSGLAFALGCVHIHHRARRLMHEERKRLEREKRTAAETVERS